MIVEERPDLTPRLVLGTVCDGQQGYFLTPETVLPFFQAHAGVMVICHNAAFDFRVTQDLLGQALDLYRWVEEGTIWDTLILKRLLSLATEGHTARGAASLADCAKSHLGVDIDKDLQDASGQDVRRGFGQFWGKPLAAIPAPYLRYAAADALVTWHLFQELDGRIRDVLQGASSVWGHGGDKWLGEVVEKFGPLTHHIQLRASIVTDELCRNGIGIDPARCQEKLQQLTAIKERCETQLTKHGLPVSGPGSGVALQQALDLYHASHPAAPLKRTIGGKWATAQEYLNELADDIPGLHELLMFRNAEKLISTYVAKMRRPRLHPHFGYLLVTGRTYCDGGFNLQNLPKELNGDPDQEAAATIRGCFVAGPGHVFLDADFAQIELVVLAYVLKHQFQLGDSLFDLINTGTDVHRRIAAAVLNKTPDEVTKSERNSAKAISFGRPGGMGVASLQQIAKTTYGQQLTAEEVERRIAAYHELCPELDAFLNDEVDAGLVLASELGLTPAGYRAATGTGGQVFREGDDCPQGWLGAMLLKVLREPRPSTRNGRSYTDSELDYFWRHAQLLPLDLKPALQVKLQARRADPDLAEAVGNWAGRRSVFTWTGRLRANATFCSSRNCVFQGVAADGAILALWKLWRAGYTLVAAVHDQNVIECPADNQVPTKKAAVERLMIEGMLEVIPGMQVRVETVVTRSLDKRDADPRYLGTGSTSTLTPPPAPPLSVEPVTPRLAP